MGERILKDTLKHHGQCRPLRPGTMNYYYAQHPYRHKTLFDKPNYFRFPPVAIMLMFGIGLMSLGSCNSPDEPVQEAPVKLDYEWTLDTIRYESSPQLFLESVYGTANGDVFASSFCSETGRGILWRYNSGIWKEVPINSKYGGPLDGAVIAIVGLGGIVSDRVWMAGTRSRTDSFSIAFDGFLAAYDGITFREIDLRDKPELICLDVVSDREVYFGGAGQVLYRYIDNALHEYVIPSSLIQETVEYSIRQFFILDISVVRENVYVRAALDCGAHGVYGILLSMNNDESWSVESFGRNDLGIIGTIRNLWSNSQGRLYTGGQGIYEFDDRSWKVLAGTTKLLLLNGFSTSPRNIWGVGVKNEVIQIGDGIVRHHEIPLPDSARTIDWVDVLTNDEEVFIVGRPWDSTNIGVIARGK